MNNNESISMDEGFQLEKYWKIIKPRLHIVIFITIFAVIAAFIKISTQDPIYQASGQLLIEPDRNVISFDRFSYYDYRNEYFNTQIEILKSRSLMKTVMNEMRSLSGTIPVGNLIITPKEFTRLVMVSYRSKDPEVAANFVNTLFSEYIEFNLGAKTQSSKEASEFITDQIKTLQKNLAQKEEELQKYGKRKELYYLSSRESTIVNKFSDLNKAYTQAQIARVNKESIFQELKEMNFEDYPQVKKNALINSLKTRHSSLESEYKKKSQIFKDSYPEMTQIKSQMEALQQRIQQEIRDIAIKTFKEAKSEYQSALKKEKSLSELLNEQKGVVVSSNADAIYYNSLSIEVNNMRNLLDYLVRKQKQSLVSSRLEGLQASNIRVIDKAIVPKSPISSGKKRTLILAFMLGLLISFALIFLVDFLDRSIKSPEDVKSLLGIPTLGVIPSSKSKSATGKYYYSNKKYFYYYSKKNPKKKNPEIQDIELINYKDPECLYSENYRSIRTSILLSTPKEPPRIITIGSALPSEGKTVTVINLAISFTQLGKKVLIIDADLRKPRMHTIFRIKNTSGLSTYLVGKADTSEIIKKTHVPNLFLIPSGPIPPNPVELINSQIMEMMLKNLTDKVDFIFIDTPPLIGIVDPILLFKYSDGVVVVTWAGKTNRNSVKKAMEELGEFKIRVLGVVLNRLDFKKERYGYEYYRKYKYNYQYRYKEEEDN